MDEAPELTGAIDAAWLFDEELYRARYPDLTEERLAAEGFDGLLQHYLCRGDREGRSGSLFFDPAYYCGQLSAEQAVLAIEVGALAHYLRGIDGGEGEPRGSIYFDPAWYVDRYPAVAQAIAAGQWRCALHHYLTNDTPTAFDPLPFFSEQFYLTRYRDVADAVAAGILRGGYQHFLKHGASELRAPCAGIDLGQYVTDDGAVGDALWTGRARDPFAHYLTHGRAEQAADTRLPTEAEAAALSCARAETMLPVLARRRLAFSCGDDPELSVVVVTCDHLAAVMRTLALLRTTFSGSIELLLVDAGSQDDTRLIERFVTGARLLRLESDPGRLGARNAALACATAGAVLLLDDAVEPAPGAIEAALRRLGSDPTIGAVGGKVIRPHGRLREAGGIVGRDGTTELYLRDQLPTAPEANFVREVDFCSGLFLLVRGALLNQLGGFDEGFAAGAADVDLCLRIAGAGYRVVYDPGVIVHHSGAWSVDNPELLFARHGQHLQSRPPPASDMQIVARSTRAERRVLFIDDTVPLRMAGSGFVRSNDLITAMTSIGFAVTMFPMAPSPFGPAAIAADLPDTVEVMHQSTADDIASFLRHRAGYYDAIWIARTHNLDRSRAALERSLADANPPLLVLDTEAIAALRNAERAGLLGQRFDLNAALAQEFRNAGLCQRIVAVNAAEAATLRGLGFAAVSAIGHVRTVRLTERSFADRAGMLFIGAIHDIDSPNHDGLCWFIEQVLPLVERQLGWQTRLTVAGYVAPGVSLQRYRDHPRVTLRGSVGDLEPLYDAHRVFVAPTRYAAGLPYKVHEAASFGLPVMATELLRRQLGWDHEHELLAAEPGDPAEFARQVVRLHCDGALWQRLREGAAARIVLENGRGPYTQALRAVLGA